MQHFWKQVVGNTMSNNIGGEIIMIIICYKYNQILTRPVPTHFFMPSSEEERLGR